MHIASSCTNIHDQERKFKTKNVAMDITQNVQNSFVAGIPAMG